MLNSIRAGKSSPLVPTGCLQKGLFINLSILGKDSSWRMACRTGVIFGVFQENRDESEASAKRELRAWGGSRSIF